MRRRHTTPALPRAALYLAALALLPTSAQAVRLDYELGLAVMHSDNIGLSETNKISDTVVSPQLRFRLEQTGAALQLSADGDVQYPYYLDDTFDNKVQGSLHGRANWTVAPERIDFEVTNSLSRQAINVLESFVPSNQQQVNVFTAGPTFSARFGDTTTGRLDLRYINTYAEESSEFQGNRYNAVARVERRLRSTDTFAIAVEALQTDYDDAGSLFDYRRYDGYVSYSSTLRNWDLQADAGYSRIEPENYDGDSSSPLFRGDLAWRIAPRSTLRAGLNYEFADAAQNLIWRPGETTGPILENPVDPFLPIGAQTFRQRRASLGYGFAGETLSVQINPYYERLRYLTASNEDQDVKSVSVFADYRLNHAMTFSFAGVRQEREFQDISRNDTNTVVNLALTRQFSRHWYGRAYYQRSERDSSSLTQSYTENSVMLMVAYRR